MTAVGTVYAQALYSLAAEEHCEREILQQLTALKQAFEDEPDFIRLLCAPNIPKDERCRILDGSFRDKVHPYVLNFMKLLTEKGYMRCFCDCCDAFEANYDRAHDILVVTAVSAVPLTEDSRSRLRETLAARTGKTIRLRCCVDPACYGGLRLEYDGKCIDGTLAHRLDAMRELLKNTVL